MAHGLFLLQFSKFSFALGGFCQLLKKLQFPSFQWVSLPISSFSFALGRSIRENCWTSCHFRTAGKSHFYDFIVLRGPSPVSFVHCQGFLRNLSMSLHTNRWHMAYFLCNFQGVPLLWVASAQLLKKLQFPCFSHCRTASLLWFHCAKGTKPSFFRPLPRFLAEFEHVTAYKQMAHGLFSLQFSRFSFAWGGFCQTAEKVAISMFFPMQESLILMISLR